MNYICFDVGNVLHRCDFNPFIRYLSKQLNITIEDAQYFLIRTQKLHDLGYTTMKEELKERLDVKSSVIIEDALKLWSDCSKPDLKLLEALNIIANNSQLQIALLSNVGQEHAADMNKNNLLQGYIKHFSCFVGARKPTDLFYQSFLMQYPEFKSCLYVDDIKENLDIGEKFGFEPFQFSLENNSSLPLILKVHQRYGTPGPLFYEP